MKFGGTSVADIKIMKNAVSKICEEINNKKCGLQVANGTVVKVDRAGTGTVVHVPDPC